MVKYPENTHWLNITSYVGMDVTAKHFYGKIEPPEGKGVQLQRTFDLEEAIQLDIKDQSNGIYQRSFRWAQEIGKLPTTDRFNSIGAVRKAAREYCKENRIEWLVQGSSCYAQSQFVILCPDHIDKPRLIELYRELEALDTNNPANDDRWDEIDEEFNRLINEQPV